MTRREPAREPLFPLAVYAIVLLNIALFTYELVLDTPGARDAFVNAFALIPYDVTHGIQLGAPAPPTPLTLLTAQFLHGSFAHVGSNMLFLLVFGPEIEYLTGHARFLAFYLACGVLGGLAEISVMPGSHVPSIGASGAIAGVLGAYIVRRPLRSVETVVPAFLAIGLWALAQFVLGFGSLSDPALAQRGGATAYFAHIGGFLAGIFAIGRFAIARRTRGARRYKYYY